MSEYLVARMQHIVALLSNTMDVVDNPGELAPLKGTVFVLHELLEAVFGQLFVLGVVRLVLL